LRDLGGTQVAVTSTQVSSGGGAAPSTATLGRWRRPRSSSSACG
jgi:hypothetical protein